MELDVQKLSKKTKMQKYGCLMIAILSFVIMVEELILVWTSVVREGEINADFLSYAVYAFGAFGFTYMLWKIFRDIDIDRKPFAKKIIKMLRVMELWTVVFAFVPSIFVQLVTTGFAGEPELDFVQVFMRGENFFILLLAIGIGLIREIFVYGDALQEDNDSIA